MSDEEKIEKLGKAFMSLSEGGKQYTLAVVDALAYAAELTQEHESPDEHLPKEESV